MFLLFYSLNLLFLFALLVFVALSEKESHFSLISLFCIFNTYLVFVIISNCYIAHSEYKTPIGEIPKWLSGDGCISNGFQFQSGSKGVTNGISMWSEVFMINRNGKQMYVVILDSQGLYDNGKENDMDKCIFGMTTFLSSFQIFNFRDPNTLLFNSLSGLSS